MKVVLNNVEQNVIAGAKLEEVLFDNDVLTQKGIAVAVNYTVIPKETWKDCKLKENDEIMIITATAGG